MAQFDPHEPGADGQFDFASPAVHRTSINTEHSVSLENGEENIDIDNIVQNSKDELAMESKKNGNSLMEGKYDSVDVAKDIEVDIPAAYAQDIVYSQIPVIKIDQFNPNNNNNNLMHIGAQAQAQAQARVQNKYGNANFGVAPPAQHLGIGQERMGMGMGMGIGMGKQVGGPNIQFLPENGSKSFNISKSVSSTREHTVYPPLPPPTPNNNNSNNEKNFEYENDKSKIVDANGNYLNVVRNNNSGLKIAGKIENDRNKQQKHNSKNNLLSPNDNSKNRGEMKQRKKGNENESPKVNNDSNDNSVNKNKKKRKQNKKNENNEIESKPFNKDEIRPEKSVELQALHEKSEKSGSDSSDGNDGDAEFEYPTKRVKTRKKGDSIDLHCAYCKKKLAWEDAINPTIVQPIKSKGNHKYAVSLLHVQCEEDYYKYKHKNGHNRNKNKQKMIDKGTISQQNDENKPKGAKLKSRVSESDVSKLKEMRPTLGSNKVESMRVISNSEKNKMKNDKMARGVGKSYRTRHHRIRTSSGGSQMQISSIIQHSTDGSEGSTVIATTVDCTPNDNDKNDYNNNNDNYNDKIVDSDNDAKLEMEPLTQGAPIQKHEQALDMGQQDDDEHNNNNNNNNNESQLGHDRYDKYDNHYNNEGKINVVLKPASNRDNKQLIVGDNSLHSDEMANKNHSEKCCFCCKLECGMIFLCLLLFLEGLMYLYIYFLAHFPNKQKIEIINTTINLNPNNINYSEFDTILMFIFGLYYFIGALIGIFGRACESSKLIKLFWFWSILLVLYHGGNLVLILFVSTNETIFDNNIDYNTSNVKDNKDTNILYHSSIASIIIHLLLWMYWAYVVKEYYKKLNDLKLKRKYSEPQEYDKNKNNKNHNKNNVSKRQKTISNHRNGNQDESTHFKIPV